MIINAGFSGHFLPQFLMQSERLQRHVQQRVGPTVPFQRIQSAGVVARSFVGDAFTLYDGGCNTLLRQVVGGGGSGDTSANNHDIGGLTGHCNFLST